MYQHADQTYLERPAQMSEDIFRQVLGRIVEYLGDYPLRKMALLFHGGEPLLIGKKVFQRYVELAMDRLGGMLDAIQVQSNGILIDDEWMALFEKYNVHLGISLDGPEAIHDVFRMDHAGRGSHHKTEAIVRQLVHRGLLSSTISVAQVGRSGAGVYEYFRSLGVKRMDFLLPDATHDSKGRLFGNITGTPVADYLIPIWNSWFAEDDPSTNIRLFTDIMFALNGCVSGTDATGNNRPGYLVIDTDGSIQSSDALKICYSGAPDSGLNVALHRFSDLELGSPLVYRVVHSGVDLCETCKLCPHSATCGGGFLPHRYSSINDFDNPSVWCADLFHLITHITDSLGTD